MIPLFNEEKPVVREEVTEEEKHLSPIKRLLKRGAQLKLKLSQTSKRNSLKTNKTKSVRPSPEEAEKWAKDFMALIDSKYGQALFKCFLQKEFCEENLELWLAVEDYRESNESKLKAKAHQIYSVYIAPQASKEVNLDSVTKQSLGLKIDQPTRTMFDPVQKRIQGLLEADAYTRFLTSSAYLDLVRHE